MRVSSAARSRDGFTCVRGEYIGFKSPEMLHVWFVDHPKGAYATSMSLTPDILRRGIRKDLLEVAKNR
jgi:hypothetical protein